MGGSVSKCEVGGGRHGAGKVQRVFIQSFFSLRSSPSLSPEVRTNRHMHGGTGDNALGPSATKARGQNTEHDRVARRRCYLDDRVHGEQRQRCHRHRCHCHDIPGIWRFGRERLLCARTTRTQTHEKKDWTATNCRCRSGARSFVEQIIKLRRHRRRREIFALTLLRDHHRGRDCQQRSIARAMTL